MTVQRVVKAIVIIGAANFIVLGIWAFGWPQNFYDVVAPYPPFNLHLFHDAGAFQLGIGAAMLGGLFWRDALFVGLLGGSVGAVVHAISHIMDRNLGGRPSDPWTLSVVAALLVVALLLRLRAKPPAHRSAT